MVLIIVGKYLGLIRVGWFISEEICRPHEVGGHEPTDGAAGAHVGRCLQRTDLLASHFQDLLLEWVFPRVQLQHLHKTVNVSSYLARTTSTPTQNGKRKFLFNAYNFNTYTTR